MKKFLLSLATVLCASAFASAGSVTFSFYSSSGVNNYGFEPAYTNSNTAYIANGSTAKLDPITITLNEAAGKTQAWRNWTDGLRAYAKSKKPTLKVSGDNVTITEVSFALKSGLTITADNGSMAKSTAATANTWTGSNADVTFTFSGSGNYAIQTLTITYTAAEGVSVSAPTFSVKPGIYSEAQTVELSADAGCAIYYTLDGQDPTDDVDDGSTIKYSAPISITETTTIKAIAVDADDNFSSIATGDYKIVELLEGATGAGTEADPYNTIAAYNEALLGHTNTVYVKGIISSIYEVSTTYGNASYYISEDGTQTNEFYIFRGYYLGAVKFTAEDQIKVGDVVVVKGGLTTYNDVPQIGQYNELISINGTGEEPIVLEGDGSDSNPFTVADVIAINPSESSANEEYPDKYWVKGYIVGYSSSSSSAFTPIFNADAADSNTNLILGPTADCTDKSLCVPVQLPSGDVRTALNLKDNPSNLGKEVYVYGNIYKYFNLPGVKNVTDYKLDPSGIADVELDNNAPVEYFNLQGVRVANPENGLFIMRQGDKVVKVIK